MRLGDLDALRAVLVEDASPKQRDAAVRSIAQSILAEIDAAPTICCERCEHEGWCQQEVVMFDVVKRKRVGILAPEYGHEVDACSNFKEATDG